MGWRACLTEQAACDALYAALRDASYPFLDMKSAMRQLSEQLSVGAHE